MGILCIDVVMMCRDKKQFANPTSHSKTWIGGFGMHPKQEGRRDTPWSNPCRRALPVRYPSRKTSGKGTLPCATGDRIQDS